LGPEKQPQTREPAGRREDGPGVKPPQRRGACEHPEGGRGGPRQGYGSYAGPGEPGQRYLRERRHRPRRHLMGARLAAWLFGKMSEKHVIGFIWLGEFPACPGEILAPHEVEVVFRGK